MLIQKDHTVSGDFVNFFLVRSLEFVRGVHTVKSALLYAVLELKQAQLDKEEASTELLMT